MAQRTFDYSDAPELVQGFLNYKLIIQNRSKLTVYNYYHDLYTFTRYLLKSRNKVKYQNTAWEDIPFTDADNELYLDVKSSEVFEFLAYVADKRDNGSTARNRKLSCLRVFYKYIERNTQISVNNPTEKIDSPRKEKKLPKFLSLDESKQLLSTIDGKNTERDFAIITLFLNCGLRVSELVGIDINDMDDKMETVTVTGKGSKQRRLYLNDACRGAITAYLKVRPKDVKYDDRYALFISRNRNRVSVQTVQNLIYKHLENAGLGHLGMSVHKLRHTAATLMYNYGGTDVRVLKDILGHEELSTTQIYTHVSDSKLVDAANNNPLAGGVKRTGRMHESDDEN